MGQSTKVLVQHWTGSAILKIVEEKALGTRLPPVPLIPLQMYLGSHMTSLVNFKMASQSQGIQQLLQAEKRAETMVSEARKRKKIFSNIFTLFRVQSKARWHLKCKVCGVFNVAHYMIEHNFDWFPLRLNLAYCGLVCIYEADLVLVILSRLTLKLRVLWKELIGFLRTFKSRKHEY